VRGSFVTVGKLSFLLDANVLSELTRSFLDGLVLSGLEVLPYDARAAVWHADERARLQKVGKPRPYVDSQIAAIAGVNGLTLVIRNGLQPVGGCQSGAGRRKVFGLSI
jgi:predicted nucleic acid-binding protein